MICNLVVEPEERRDKYLKRLLHSLPPRNQHTLHSILMLLSGIALSTANNLSFEDLGSIFGMFELFNYEIFSLRYGFVC